MARKRIAKEIKFWQRFKKTVIAKDAKKQVIRLEKKYDRLRSKSSKKKD